MPQPQILHRIASIGPQSGEGVCHTHVGTLQAYLKPDAGYVIANEQIASAIGQFLRLPVPAFGLAHANVRGVPLFFASMSFNFSAESLPPCNVAEIAADQHLCAGILVFDSFIGNLDRHAKNLAYHPEKDLAIVFDHSHAVLGETHGHGPERMTALRDEACLNLEKKTDPRYTRHCLIDALTDGGHLPTWFDKVRSIPDWWLKETVESAHKLTTVEQSAAIDFLQYRRDNLASIFDRHLHLFPNLEQSPLPSS